MGVGRAGRKSNRAGGRGLEDKRRTLKRGARGDHALSQVNLERPEMSTCILKLSLDVGLVVYLNVKSP